MQLNDPIDPEETLDRQSAEQHILNNIPLALIESAQRLDMFEATIEMRRIRQVPANPQISINLQVQLPPNINPNQMTTQAQQLLQQLISQATQSIGLLVQQEITRQSPVTGVNLRLRGGRWYDRTSDVP